MKAKTPFNMLIALAATSLAAVSSASAATYYWDGNNDTSGFASASGTWADPTAGTLTSGWSTDSTGATAVDGNSVTTTTSDPVFFGTNTTGNGLGAGTITVSGTVNAANITFGSQSGAVELSGGTIHLAAAGQITLSGGAITIHSVISGAGTSLTKAGNSQLTLTGLNTYTGATRIGSSTGGYLAVAHIANGGIASGIGASSSAASNLVLANDNFGGLNYIGSANASTDRDFTIANGGGAYSGAIASSGTGTLTFTSTNAVSYVSPNGARNFVLAGSNTAQNALNARLVNNGTGALTFQKTGTATWVLANETSSYTGSTTIRGIAGVGILSVSKMADYGTDSSIGKGTAGTAIGFDDAALVYTGSGDDTDRLVRTDRSGAIINNGTGALNFTATGNFNVTTTQTLLRGLTFGGTHGGTISGAIQNNSNALSVTKSATGTWTLAGSNTYTGNTDVNAGTLRLQSGATTITQTLGALRSQSADGTLNSNKSGAGSITTTFSSYSRAAGATGNIVSTGGTNGTDNSVNITGTAGFINAGLHFGGSDFAARNATDGYVRALNYATTGGDTNTVDVDTVTASRHVKLATTSYSGAGMTLLSLNLAGGGINWTNTTGNLSVPGIIKSGGGSQSTISGGNLATPSNVELVIRTDTSSDSLLISSNLTHGGGTLTKSGAGTLTLSGTNSTFTGQTHINAGTLSISSNANLGAQTTGATLNLKGGTLQATGTFGLFNGTAGTNNRAVTLLNQSTIEVTGSNTLTIAGVMSNLSSTYGTTGGFNKTGTGTLALSGANTYTGATAITAGTLKLGANDVLPNGSAVSIGTATLDADTSTDTLGTLDVTGSAVINLGSGAALAFANSSAVGAGTWAGTLNLVGFVSGSSLNFGSSTGLTAAQLAKISATGFSNFSLDAEGDLIADFGGGSLYETWANATYVPPLTAKLPGDDQDGDGFNNLMEYAFGTQPTVAASGSIGWVNGGAVTTPGQPVAINVANPGVDFRAVFGRRKDHVAAGLTYTVEFSAGLDVWVASGDTPTVLTGAGGLNPSDIEAVSVPYPLLIPVGNNEFKKPTFFRVKITGP